MAGYLGNTEARRKEEGSPLLIKAVFWVPRRHRFCKLPYAMLGPPPLSLRLSTSSRFPHSLTHGPLVLDRSHRTESSPLIAFIGSWAAKGRVACWGPSRVGNSPSWDEHRCLLVPRWTSSLPWLLGSLTQKSSKGFYCQAEFPIKPPQHFC